MTFVCHVTLEDHLIKQSCGFIEELIKISHDPANFDCTSHFCSRDIQVFVCHVTLEDHAVKALCDSMVRSLSMYIAILPSSVAIGTVVV